jgi:hypothetical protein
MNTFQRFSFSGLKAMSPLTYFFNQIYFAVMLREKGLKKIPLARIFRFSKKEGWNKLDEELK